MLALQECTVEAMAAFLVLVMAYACARQARGSRIFPRFGLVLSSRTKVNNLHRIGRRSMLYAICLMFGASYVEGSKNRDWLSPNTLSRGSSPSARSGYGMADIDDLIVIFGGSVGGSLTVSICSTFYDALFSRNPVCVVVLLAYFVFSSSKRMAAPSTLAHPLDSVFEIGT